MTISDLNKIIDSVENKNLLFQMRVYVPKIRVFNICEGTDTPNLFIFNGGNSTYKKPLTLARLQSLIKGANPSSEIRVRDTNLQEMYSIEGYTIKDKVFELIG